MTGASTGLFIYIKVASSGHSTAQDIDKVLRGAESRHDQAGRTTRHGWHSTVEMQAWHGTDNTGTALRPGIAARARADDLAWQGTAWHGKARPAHIFDAIYTAFCGITERETVVIVFKTGRMTFRGFPKTAVGV